MPEFECQAYWHEMPDPVVPWSLEAAKEEHKTQHRPNGGVRTRPLALDQGLTPTGAVNEVFVALGCLPLARGEMERAIISARNTYAAEHAGSSQPVAPVRVPGKRISRRVHSASTASRAASVAESNDRPIADPRQHVDDPPLLRALRTVVAARGLQMETVERRTSGEKLHRHNFFEPNASAVFIVDRERPQFLAAYGVPARENPANCMINVMVPIRDPEPFRLHTRTLANISRNECLVLKCWRPREEGGAEEDGPPETSAAVSRATSRRRPRDDEEEGSNSRAVSQRRPSQPRPSLDAIEPVAHTPNAWAAIPAVEAPQKTRLKRSIKQAWYHRIMPTTCRRHYRELVASRFTNLAAGSSDDDSDD